MTTDALLPLDAQTRVGCVLVNDPTVNLIYGKNKRRLIFQNCISAALAAVLRWIGEREVVTPSRLVGRTCAALKHLFSRFVTFLAINLCTFQAQLYGNMYKRRDWVYLKEKADDSSDSSSDESGGFRAIEASF